jgi:hypothetical protein
MYDLLAKQEPWATVQCFDEVHGMIRSPQDIGVEVFGTVEKVLTRKDGI